MRIEKNIPAVEEQKKLFHKCMNKQATVSPVTVGWVCDFPALKNQRLLMIRSPIALLTPYGNRPVDFCHSLHLLLFAVKGSMGVESKCLKILQD